MIVDDLSIVTEIERLHDFVRRMFEHQAKYRQYASEGRLQAWMVEHPNHDLWVITKTLISLLQQHPTFGHTKDRFFGTKQLTLFPQYQVNNLLQLAAEQGAEAAVAWLHRVSATNTADLRFVAEVHGLSTNEQHTLRNGVTLMPLDRLPPSENARIAVAQYLNQTSPWETFDFTHPSIGAMLIVRQVPGLHRHLADPPLSNELACTIRAFTLADGAAPVLGTSWIEFVNPDLARAEFGRMWMRANFDGTLWSVLPTEITTDALLWVDRYLQLHPGIRSSCDIAIERLNLARRRRSPGNKAIEGAICLEALLGDGSAQELTYKLKLRAALLLTPKLDERREIVKAVNDFYELRSKTVHGHISRAKDIQRDVLRANRGLEICTAALREIVQRNRKFVPQDWELSGGVPPDDAPDAD
jgi:hypothetical protein